MPKVAKNEPEKEPTGLLYKTGQKIKLASYQKFGDWKRHKGQVGTIVGVKMEGGYLVKWADGNTSAQMGDDDIIPVDENESTAPKMLPNVIALLKEIVLHMEDGTYEKAVFPEMALIKDLEAVVEKVKNI
jgi:hypothetical protein